MPIDPDKARGASLPDGETSYSQDDVILYHLGVGAGVPATDPGELEYTYEKNLKVLPSFAVIPAFGSSFAKVLSRRMPALLIRMSTFPKLSSAVWMMALPPSGVATES